jgi:Xaa-Pro aminopeptidase
MRSRRHILQAKLTAHQVLLLSKPTDIRYYTQFEFLVPEEREAFAVITAKASYLIYGAFSPLPKSTEDLILKTGCATPQLVEHLQAIIAAEHIAGPELMFDPTDLHVEEYQALMPITTQLVPFEATLTWQQRLYKDDTELTNLKHAGQIANQAYERVQSQLQPGISEQAVRQLLDRTMEDLGSERPAFPTIVAFGAHGALPHHQPDKQMVLAPEMPVLLDFGATFAGYRSDMTRSFWFGRQPTKTFLAIEKLVHQAYQAAFDRLCQHAALPTLARDIDTAARTAITEAGYGKNFIHTTGHGVGLEIHEPPSISWRNEQVIKPGMILTIEPGIYLEGEFGYRYENTVITTAKSTEILTAP